MNDEEKIHLLRIELEKVEQHLGRALGYPKFPSDWPHGDEFPFDSEAVCVGEHTAETLAMTAADEIKRLRTRVADLEDALAALRDAVRAGGWE